MRLDKYLKVSRLIKRRTLAKEVAENERILVNDRLAKPSKELNIGDIITIEFGNKVVKDDDLFTVRMTHIHSQTGQKLLDGCFRIGNMIPIPNSELSSFTIKSEPNSYLKKRLGEIYKFDKK